MKEPFIELLEYPERTAEADPGFAATLNDIADSLLTIGKEILALWNEVEVAWPAHLSPVQNAVWKKELTLTPGELADVKAAIAETRTATSLKELTTDDAFKKVYQQYKYALSRFYGLRMLNTKMLRDLTTIATVAKTKK